MLKVKILMSACALGLLSGSLVYASDSAEGVIEYRDKMMDATKQHMGAAGLILKGAAPFKQDLALHANALRDLLADTARLFPEGSDFGETNAKAEVWSQAAEFKQASDEAAAKSNAFAEAVAGGDAAAIGGSFEALGKTCKGCHDTFRAKH